LLNPAAFVALTVKLYDSAEVGVPEMTPDAVSRDNPVGRVPELTDHVIGTEPDALMVCEYCDPIETVPLSDVVVIVGATAAPIVPVYVLVLDPNPLVAATVKL
jgi:hypothetical protein